MIRNNLYVIFVLLLLIQSCYSDKTTTDINEISEIEISFGEYDLDVIEIDKNEVLIINPVVTQAVKEKSLTYEWEIDQEIYSNENSLNYTGASLGTFLARLKVSNEDGSSFKAFKIRVNSPYEEGLLILGEDESRIGSLGFIKRYPELGIEQTPIDEVESDTYLLNNEERLGKGITDIVKRGSQFFISSEDNGSVTLINGQTMEKEALITAPDYPDFKPFRLNIPDNAAVSALVLTREGILFRLATKEHLVLRHTSFDSSVKFEPKTQFVVNPNFTMHYFWDQNASRLWNLWFVESSSKNEFEGQELYTFFAANNQTFTLTKQPGSNSLIKTVFGAYIQEYLAEPLDIIEQVEFTTAGVVPEKTSITLVDEKLFRLLHVNESSIYQWYFSGTNFTEPPLLTIDVEGEITSLARNIEGKELFIGVYNKNAAGKKGSILVYNIENGRKMGQFIGITDKPVKLLYKNKNK